MDVEFIREINEVYDKKALKSLVLQGLANYSKKGEPFCDIMVRQGLACPDLKVRELDFYFFLKQTESPSWTDSDDWINLQFYTTEGGLPPRWLSFRIEVYSPKDKRPLYSGIIKTHTYKPVRKEDKKISSINNTNIEMILDEFWELDVFEGRTETLNALILVGQKLGILPAEKRNGEKFH